MNFEQFDEFQDNLLKEVKNMGATKGKEYANSESRFANFDRLADQLGLTNIQVAWVYTAKHLDSIAQFCRTGQTYSTETIQGRIVDAITYLTLIAGMIEEATEKLGESASINSFPFKVDDIQQQKVVPNNKGIYHTCRQCSFTTNNLHDLRQHYVVNPTHSGS